MNIFFSGVFLLTAVVRASAENQPQVTAHIKSAIDDGSRLTGLLDEATELLKTSADAAFTYLFEESDGLSAQKKAAVLDLVFDNIVTHGVNPEADDAIVQLKTARLVLKMKKAYEELDPALTAFAEEEAVLSEKFTDPDAELLSLMEEVEGFMLEGKIDNAYNFMFHASEDASRDEKIKVFRKLFDNIKEAGVDPTGHDALLQIQTTLCVIEMLHILEDGDLTSFLEEGNWEAAQKLVQSPASFVDAVDVLPGLSDEIKSKTSVFEVEKKLESMRKKIEMRLSGLSAEDNRGEVQFSYDMLDLLNFIEKEAPSNFVEKDEGEH